MRSAEALFAKHGYDGVSARTIAAKAGVPLALLSYHFGPKLDLYRAVFQRRIDPLSERRRRALNQILSRIEPPPTIEEILDALARPWVEMRDEPGGDHYSRLIAREVGDPRESERGIVAKMLDPIALEFIDGMERTLPGVSRAEIHWAYYIFIGALLLVLTNPKRMKRLSGELCDAEDSQAVISHIVNFSVRALSNRDNMSYRKPESSADAIGHIYSGQQRSTKRRPH